MAHFNLAVETVDYQTGWHDIPKKANIVDINPCLLYIATYT
jgi:hypothetical protein